MRHLGVYLQEQRFSCLVDRLAGIARQQPVRVDRSAQAGEETAQQLEHLASGLLLVCQQYQAALLPGARIDVGAHRARLEQIRVARRIVIGLLNLVRPYERPHALSSRRDFLISCGLVIPKRLQRGLAREQ